MSCCKRSIIVVVCSMFMVISVFASGKSNEPVQSLVPQFRAYGFAENFQWKEYIDGEELVKEDGPLVGVGGELTLLLGPVLVAHGVGEFFVGRVDYDGQVQNLQDGTIEPLKDKTDYAGVKGEGDLGIKAKLSDNAWIKPFAGGGARIWRRKLGADKACQYGYNEDWFTLYALVGGELVVETSPQVSFFLNGSVRYPLYNQVSYDFNTVGLEDTDVNPKREFSFYAEAGINVKPVTASAFVETMKFSKSDLDDKTHMVYQPKSEAIMFGAKCGFVF